MLQGIKIGWSQRNIPPPPLIDRILKAGVYFFTACGILINGIPEWLLHDKEKVLLGLMASVLLMLLQTVAILTGSSKTELKKEEENNGN